MDTHTAPRTSPHGPPTSAAPASPRAAAQAGQSAGGAARELLLAGRVRLLVATTISHNVVAAAVALTAGAAASSTALVGFGLDSVIEVGSAAASARQHRERTALPVIALSFFALAGYVPVESIRALVGGGHPSTSRVGLVVAALAPAEGRRAWQGDSCCTPGTGSRAPADATPSDEPTSCCAPGATCCAAPAGAEDDAVGRLDDAGQAAR